MTLLHPSRGAAVPGEAINLLPTATHKAADHDIRQQFDRIVSQSPMSNINEPTRLAFGALACDVRPETPEEGAVLLAERKGHLQILGRAALERVATLPEPSAVAEYGETQAFDGAIWRAGTEVFSLQTHITGADQPGVPLKERPIDATGTLQDVLAMVGEWLATTTPAEILPDRPDYAEAIDRVLTLSEAVPEGMMAYWFSYLEASRRRAKYYPDVSLHEGDITIATIANITTAERCRDGGYWGVVLEKVGLDVAATFKRMQILQDRHRGVATP